MEQAAGGVSERQAQERGQTGSLPNMFPGLRFDVQFVTDAGAEFGNGLVQAQALLRGLKFQDVGRHVRRNLTGIRINFAGHIV